MMTIDRIEIHRLSELIEAIDKVRVLGGTEFEVCSITSDSRAVQEGALFVAIKGLTVDGHNFTQSAIDKGASALVVEQIPESPDQSVTWIQVKDSADAIGQLSAAFCNQPSLDLSLIGVTGTNGKTSTVTLLHQLMVRLGAKSGLLSTIQVNDGDQSYPAKYTTPDVVALNSSLSEMVANGCENCFMEVSSHAVSQKRINGLQFAGAVFTNLTHDHIDYHGSFQAYLNAKKAFIDGLSKQAFVLVNADDRNGMVMLQNTAARKLTYSLKKPSDFKGKLIQCDLSGIVLQIDGVEIHSSLIGEFNAYNLLAVYATARMLGYSQEELLPAISTLESVDGRFQYLISPIDRITAVVDYAHTPDALEKVLQTIAGIRLPRQKVIVVVGCGGDRDTQKRPIMASVAANYADQLILTSDNPRSEEPKSIIQQMAAGLSPDDQRKTLSITDREEAIRTSCMMAKAGDIILVAGKGHETYQEIAGVRHDFDDKVILQNCFKDLGR